MDPLTTLDYCTLQQEAEALSQVVTSLLIAVQTLCLFTGALAGYLLCLIINHYRK